jgi:N-succinyldiaminopimelate aminotransferase
MRPIMAARLEPFRASIFDEMKALARERGALDLSSGTPTMPIPAVAAEAAAREIAAGRNQYTPVVGDIALRRAIAAHGARFYDARIDPETEVSVTCGVTEAIQAAMTAFVEPGDEVVVIEPCYDAYAPSILLAGGVPKPVALRAPDFRLDADRLAAAFSPRTKAIIVNNPHNPTGRVFERGELEAVAELCRRYDALAISDEVYEHVVFDGRKHIRLASLPGMQERTLTLSGASKTFACTGWRIGWAIGPAPLQAALIRARQFSVFCAATPLQLAIAESLDLGDAYYADLAADYQSRRDLLTQGLLRSPFPVIRPESAFFALVPFDPARFASGRDCCLALLRDYGVASIPLDSFYVDKTHAEPLIRFTFCHPRERLEEAARRLTQAAVAAS